MRGKSILLALSGSQQSRYATEVCWQLARQLGATITAHHVVDSHSAWQFVGHEKPGFLKSEKYLAAYQALTKSLFCLGEDLAEAYTSEAKKLGIDDICIVDEGNPIELICKRALDHKLVVIGHRPHVSEHNISGQLMRLSIAESLSNQCERPLMVVQGESKAWTSLTMLISMDHVNENYINSCMDIAKTLNLSPVLLCLSGGAHEESPESFIADIREANPRLAHMPVAVTPAKQNLTLQVDTWYIPEGSQIGKEDFQNTLVVIPTRQVGGQRISVADSSPAMFVRYNALPTILLWPEEYKYAPCSDELTAAHKSQGATI